MPSPIFVLGAPRSGTTLLRVMLAGHPLLFAPPEMVLAPFATMAERKVKLDERFWEKGGLRRAIMELDGCTVDEAKDREAALLDLTVPEVYQWLQAKLVSRTLVDKCPHLSADPAALDRLLQWFPDARFIWILRHPGSVTRSIENMPMAEVMLQGYAPDARDIWCVANTQLRSFVQRLGAGRSAVVRYEDLVSDGRGTLERMCAQIGLPFHEALLTPYEGDRMRDGPSGARAIGDPNMAGRGRIQPELATSWLEGFDPTTVSPATHELARELGYDLGDLPPPPMASVSAAIGTLLDRVRELESSLRVPADLDMAEGRRFLLRTLAASLDLFVEYGDPDSPRFFNSVGPTRKMFADNPDADYWRAAIRLDDGRRYRVRGHVPPGTTYVGLLVYRRKGIAGAHRHDTQFVRPDGTFDLVVGTSDDADLRGEGDETAIMIRQYFVDRQTQPPLTLSIERMDAAPPKPLDPARLAKSVERATRNLDAVFERTLSTWKMAHVGLLNRFMELAGPELFPTPDNAYMGCWYRFGQDQLMLIRGRAPKARYWSFCLYNLWMESLDYEGTTIHRHQGRIAVDENGHYEICVAHRDPGHPNWLDTTGHLAGYVLIRMLLREEPVEPPTVTVLYEREWNSDRLST